MRPIRRSLRSTLFLILFLATAAGAQQPKKSLTVEDYGRWRSVASPRLSDDGEWVAFGYARGTPFADDTLHVKTVDGSTDYMVPRGERPGFSDDGRWAAYFVATGWEEAEKLRADRKPVPRSVELMELRSGEKTTWENASAFSFSKGSRWLAVKKTKSDRDAKHDGTDLVLMNLAERHAELIGSVGEYGFNKPGTWLAWTVDAADRAGNGLYMMDLATGVRRPVDSADQEYTRLTWAEEGGGVAVLKGAKPEEKVEKKNALVSVVLQVKGWPKARVWAPSEAPGFPDGYVLSEKGTLTWSTGLDRVFLGIKEQADEPPKTKTGPQDKVANVDIWHWQDDRLQSVQMIQANRDRNFTWRAVVDVQADAFRRLTDETMKEIDITRDGRWGIGADRRAYISDWKESAADLYRVDIATGERKLILEAQGRDFGFDPDSRYLLYWKDGQFWTYDLTRDQHSDLTSNAPVDFADATFDNPGTVPPYRPVGWSRDGRSLILQHRYDLYLQPLDGKPATNLTGGVGAEQEIEFGYVRLDPDERTIDLSKPLLLTAYGQWTKKAGFYRLQKGRLTSLVYEDRSFGRVQKAEDTDRILFTRESFAEFPDYYVSGLDLKNPVQVTDAVPFQDEYRWGHTVLIDYANADGVRLQGVLAIPDGYQQGQRLPMLVDFYEKNSQNLNRYPRTIYRDTPMFSKYVSNGYLVLLPDVHFRTRTTHSDMLECVTAAVNKVVEMGYADRAKVGLHGHSFSGQGSAYIATHSDLFVAICYGAGATDLLADFNQLWKSAGTNQHRYDIYGQGRFGTNPFDDFQLFVDQSAVFAARNVTSPLLILHGTADGSVEWLQAVEFFNALRFNGKRVILCSYPDEPHHLTKLENQIDFQTRMGQFFDHYLKGTPAPKWMTDGVPFLKKAK